MTVMRDVLAPVFLLAAASSGPAQAQALVLPYSGVATYDRQPATMQLTFNGTAVTGRLHKPGECKPQIRLTQTDLTLTGTLSGPWEGTGTIAGTWVGGDSLCGNPLTDVDGYPRQGTFTISMQGTTVRLLRTGSKPLPSGWTYDFGATGTKNAGRSLPSGAGVGAEWSVSEAGIPGRWVRRGSSDTWDGTWNNGAVAVLTMRLVGDKLYVDRRDVAGPSKGLTASYEGTLAPDGTVQGSERATLPGHFTDLRQSWQGRIVRVAPESETPAPSAPRASPLAGRWAFVCCSGKYTGAFVLEQHGSQLTGTVRDTSNGSAGELAGTVDGSRVRLTRTWPGGRQEYALTLDPSGRRMTGRFDGTRDTSVGTEITLVR